MAELERGNRILWRRLDEVGLEWCDISRTPGGSRLTGVVLLSLGEAAHRIDYALELDVDGRARRVRIDVRGAADQALELVADGAGRWRRGPGDEVVVNAVDEPAAVDLDLAFSPVTNSLPIWRLASVLDFGETSEIRVAWVLYPGLDVVVGRQWYTRLGERQWRYRSEGFEAVLTVGHDGLVENYQGLWRAVARS